MVLLQGPICERFQARYPCTLEKGREGNYQPSQLDQTAFSSFLNFTLARRNPATRGANQDILKAI